MDISNFNYLLPRELIAQKPANPRDSSKLLVMDRNTEQITHTIFHNILNFLSEDDVLVFNKSKVFPARIFGQKKTKGKVEVLILKFIGDIKVQKPVFYDKDSPCHHEFAVCEVITKPGLFLYDTIYFEGFTGRVIKRDGYITHIQFDIDEKTLLGKIEIIGKTPVPPYIKSPLSEKDLREKYQTVYAKTVGSAAAPTAGLHFTKEFLKKLKKKGVQMEFITLHVGLGTFAPVKETEIEKHKIHEEFFSVDPDTTLRLNKAKKEGKRIIAVGTTTTRVLETLATKKNSLSTCYTLPATNLFIYPPHKFKFVDGLITNFHLPKSTLLALVSAFVSFPNTHVMFSDFQSSLLGRAYNEAINDEYRFFSFGDAMLIY